MRKKLFLILDTETAGDFSAPMVYDVAWRVIDKRGRVYSQHNYMVQEVATNPKLMMGAYYAKKIFSFYLSALNSQAVNLLPLAEIAARMREDAARCDVASAYNLSFDTGAMKTTLRAHGIHEPIFSRRVDTLCIWRFACEALRSRLYHDLAAARGWVSDAGNVRTTAQHAYAFLAGNFDFIESHTALDDVCIETEILARLFARKRKIPYNEPSRFAWQIAQEHI